MSITMWQCEKVASHLQGWWIFDGMCKQVPSSSSTLCVCVLGKGSSPGGSSDTYWCGPEGNSGSRSSFHLRPVRRADLS